MAVRTSMAALIARTRDLIIDPAGASQQFADQQIQDALDMRRVEVRFQALRPQPTYLPGATIVYLDYYSDVTDWEDDFVIQDLAYNTIAPSAYEPIIGHFAFTAQPNGIGIRITGKAYDVYGSSADMLYRWAAALKSNMDFGTDGQYFKRTGQIQNLLTLAAKYQELAKPRFMRMVQSDAAPEYDGGGVTYPNVAVGSEYA